MNNAREHEQLMDACLAGEMAPEEELAFLDRLETDDDLRREYVLQSGIDRLLRAASEAERGDFVRFRQATLALAQSAPDAQFHREVWEKISAAAREVPGPVPYEPAAGPAEAAPRDRQRRAAPAWSGGAWLKAAAALVLAVGTGILLVKSGALKDARNAVDVGSPAGIARLENFFGSGVQVAQAGKDWQPASAGLPLVSDARIRTGNYGRCRVRFSDGSRIDAEGNAGFDLAVRNSQKICRVTGGDLLFVVAAQPADRPMLVEGRDAGVVVKGTVFTILAREQSTLIRVNEGEVAVRAAAGPAEVPLRSGEVLDAVRGQPLVATGGNAEKARAIRWEGRGLRDNGRLEEAERKFRESIAWDSAPPSWAFLYLYVTQYERGDLEGCIATIEEKQRRKIKDEFRGFEEVFLHQCGLRLGRASNRLAEYRKGFQGDEWPAPVMDMYLGVLTPEAMLTKARNGNEKSSALLYAGEWYLLKGNKDLARRYFEEGARTESIWTDKATARRRLEQLDRRP